MEDYNAINSFPRPNLPDGFRTLLFSLSKEVLREQPSNLYEFCADYFGRRLLNRGDSWITFKERYNMRKKERAKEEESKLKSMPEPITESTTDQLAPEQFTPEQEKAVVKIQAGVRGMLVRRGFTPSTGGAHAESERWLHPQEQLQRDLDTASESISFAQLLSEDGVWEACQRWLHPAEQLQRDYAETSAEPVECAHLRDRGESLEDARAAEEASAALERSRQGGSAQRRRSSAAEVVTSQQSDLDVPGDVATQPEVGRAGSPPEVASPTHSALSVASAEGAVSPTPPARGPSIASVQPAKHSDVSLADRQEPVDPSPGERARSLEAVSAENVKPPSRPTTPPSSPVAIQDQPTASSQLDLATEAEVTEAGRAGSPPEALSPQHSDVEVAAEAPDGQEAERAGSPPEVASRAHSPVDEADGEVQ